MHVEFMKRNNVYHISTFLTPHCLKKFKRWQALNIESSLNTENGFLLLAIESPVLYWKGGIIHSDFSAIIIV